MIGPVTPAWGGRPVLSGGFYAVLPCSGPALPRTLGSETRRGSRVAQTRRCEVARATLANLTAKEYELVLETQKKNLDTLDEDGLDALLTRVRRTRTKYVKLHRAEIAEQVPVKGARGTASRAPRRSGDKAEIFEEALARVSTALGKAARASAAALKAERLAAAAPAATKAPATTKASAAPAATQGKASRAKASTKVGSRSATAKKTAADAKAKGARRQAKRDSR